MSVTLSLHDSIWPGPGDPAGRVHFLLSSSRAWLQTPSSFSLSRPKRTTSAPSRARRTAVAKPMPPVAPVIRACFCTRLAPNMAAAAEMDARKVGWISNRPVFGDVADVRRTDRIPRTPAAAAGNEHPHWRQEVSPHVAKTVRVNDFICELEITLQLVFLRGEICIPLTLIRRVLREVHAQLQVR